MGMLNRLLGQAKSATSSTTSRRTRRPAATGRATTPSRGLGGVARRLMGGRRGGL